MNKVRSFLVSLYNTIKFFLVASITFLLWYLIDNNDTKQVIAFVIFMAMILVYASIFNYNKRVKNNEHFSEENKQWTGTLIFFLMIFTIITIVYFIFSVEMCVFPKLSENCDFNNKFDVEKFITYLGLYLRIIMFLLAILAVVLATLNFGRKYGVKLSGNFKCGIEDKIPYIKEVYLLNEKDKATFIFSINIIFKNNKKIQVINFGNKPRTLGAYEFCQLRLAPVFKYSGDFIPDFEEKDVKIECVTEMGAIFLNKLNTDKVFNIKETIQALRISEEKYLNISRDVTHLIHTSSKSSGTENIFFARLVKNHFKIDSNLENHIFDNYSKARVLHLEEVKLDDDLLAKLEEYKDISEKFNDIYQTVLKEYENSVGNTLEYYFDVVKIEPLSLTNQKRDWEKIE